MRLFSLDNRLSMCASFVRENASLADIGTDHAYLPVWLVLNNKIKSALACDINEGPLSSGRETVEKYDLCDNIELRLSDGLAQVKKDEVDDVVIAGMGGELIARILSSCEWVKSEDKHFILQPMTKCEVLIKWLYDNGFEIVSQDACECDTKHYTVMMCRYTGEHISVDESFYYIGKLDPKSDSAKAYLTHVLSHLNKRAMGDKSLLSIIEKINGELL